MNRIANYYGADPAGEWGRMDRHRVEFGLTLKALAQHLPPAPAKVADVGGGPGRYAVELARKGYAVTLVDIAAANIKFAQEKAKEAGVNLAGALQADARDLSEFKDDSFDAVLLMGPLYHLLEHGQRLAACREARRILKPGKPIVASFIGRYTVLAYGAAQNVEYVTQSEGEMRAILETGIYDQARWGGGFMDAWMCHPDEIPPLMTEAGFEAIDFLHAEPLVSCLEDKINDASPELHTRWLDVLYSISRDPSVRGGSGHLLWIGCKPGDASGP